MQRHQLQGNTRFYLIATPAGKPLYNALGFRTVDDLRLFIAGHSEQFAVDNS